MSKFGWIENNWLYIWQRRSLQITEKEEDDGNGRRNKEVLGLNDRKGISLRDHEGQRKRKLWYL